VVLDHAKPPRFRVAARAEGVLLSLKRRSLRDVGARAVETRFLVVPEREADRALRAHIGTVQHARQLHDQRRARTVVVGGLAPAYAIHVGADDVHLAGARRADLRAIHLFARAGSARLRVELAQLRIGLRFWIVIHAGGRSDAAQSRTSGAGADLAAGDHRAGRGLLRPRSRRRQLVHVLQPLGLAAEALQPAFDPVDRRTIAIGPLAPVAERGQASDRGL